MTKITYIIDNLNIGGAQMHLKRLVEHLGREDYQIAIVCLGQIDQSFKDIDKEISIHSLMMDCIWKLSFWLNFLNLVSLLKKTKLTIVHTYLNTSNVFGVFAAKLAGVPKIITSRRDLGHFRSGLIGRLEVIATRFCDKVVCVSEAVRDKYVKERSIPLDKAIVIYNGVDHKSFIPKNNSNRDGSFNINMVATMDRIKKGHLYFLKAAEEIIKKRGDVKFNIIGDGCLRPSLEYYVNSRGLTDYFNFRGKRNNLVEELKKTDIFVVPSESEGCSNALLEAMAMGIPAVATAVEGNLEVIEDGVSGFLVKPKDPTAIADKILELVASNGKIKEAGMEARNRVIEKFSLKEMTRNYIKLYEGLIKRLSNQG